MRLNCLALGALCRLIAAGPIHGRFGLSEKPYKANLFNPSTQIAYEVPQQAHITPVVALQHPGRYKVTWDRRIAQGQAVSSGVYLYRLASSTGFVQSRRMLLLK